VLRLHAGVASGSMQERHWHLITDDELAALLREQGCTRVEELVQARDTIWGDGEVEKELSRSPGALGAEP
jgi:hypothetical protein